MKQLNAAYRGLDKTTDVLSFPQASEKWEAHFLLGDVVINVSKAEAQAKMSGTGFYDEIYHLLTHGILHLLGYDHEKSKSKALIMIKKEREILGAIKKMG